MQNDQNTEKAKMYTLGHGLKLSVGRDGVWLHFEASGKQCMIHVHNTLGTGSARGPGIVSQTIDSWCAEREAEPARELTQTEKDSVAMFPADPIPVRHLTDINDPFINWRCAEDNNLACPEGGCSMAEGCRRQKPTSPLQINSVTLTEAERLAEIAEIETWSALDRARDKGCGPFKDPEKQKMADYVATLLRLIRSRGAWVSEDALAALLEKLVGPFISVSLLNDTWPTIAREILSSGIVEARPSVEQVAQWLFDNFPHDPNAKVTDPYWPRKARAILAIKPGV